MAITVVSCDNPLVVTGSLFTPHHRYPGWPSVTYSVTDGRCPILDRLIPNPDAPTRLETETWDSPSVLHERKGSFNLNYVLNEQLSGNMLCLDDFFLTSLYALSHVDSSLYEIIFPQLGMQCVFSGEFSRLGLSWKYTSHVWSIPVTDGLLVCTKTLNFESQLQVGYWCEYWPDYLSFKSLKKADGTIVSSSSTCVQPFTFGFWTNDESEGDEMIESVFLDYYLAVLDTRPKGWSIQPSYKANVSAAWSVVSGSYSWHMPKSVYWDILFPIEPIRKCVKWNDLAASAYSSMPYQNNGIAYMKDFAGMKELAINTGKTAFGLLHSGRLKAISQLYLSFHYGWKLQVLDTKEFLSGLSSFSDESRLSASGGFVLSDDLRPYATYQVYYRPFARLNSLFSKLFYYFDLPIDLSNVWDMTPWSFVVDWFFNVGDVLQTIDNFNSLIQQHEVFAVGQSIKATRKLKPAQVGLSSNTCVLYGEIYATFFQRWYSSNPIPPSTNLTTSNSLTSSIRNHWVEGSTLFISNF